MLAEAGRADDARARADANCPRISARPLDACPRRRRLPARSGTTPKPSGSTGTAAALAQARGDRTDVAAVAQRLSALLADVPGREHDAAEAVRTAERALAADSGSGSPRRPVATTRAPAEAGASSRSAAGRRSPIRRPSEPLASVSWRDWLPTPRVLARQPPTAQRAAGDASRSTARRRGRIAVTAARAIAVARRAAGGTVSPIRKSRQPQARASENAAAGGSRGWRRHRRPLCGTDAE